MSQPCADAPERQLLDRIADLDRACRIATATIEHAVRTTIVDTSSPEEQDARRTSLVTDAGRVLKDLESVCRNLDGVVSVKVGQHTLNAADLLKEAAKKIQGEANATGTVADLTLVNWLRAVRHADYRLRELERLLYKSAPTESASPSMGGLKLISGGFEYNGVPYELTGRSLDILKALLRAPHRRRTAGELREELGVNDESVDYPEQVIKDNTSALRKALKSAIANARVSCENPLPSEGKGKDLTYILSVP